MTQVAKLMTKEAIQFRSGAVVKAFEFFAMGSHIHKEDGTIKVITGVLLGDDGFLDGIHAADRRAIRIVTAV